MRRKIRITVVVCVPIAGVGGTGRPLHEGTRFLVISGILVIALVSSWRRGYYGHFFDWQNGFYIDYIAEGFDPETGFPLVRRFELVVTSVCLCIGSSLYCEEPGKVSAWILQT